MVRAFYHSKRDFGLAHRASLESYPEPIRSAPKCFVELGDMRLAAKIAGLSIDEFNQLRTQAKIPVVV